MADVTSIRGASERLTLADQALVNATAALLMLEPAAVERFKACLRLIEAHVDDATYRNPRISAIATAAQGMLNTRDIEDRAKRIEAYRAEAAKARQALSVLFLYRAGQAEARIEEEREREALEAAAETEVVE